MYQNFTLTEVVECILHRVNINARLHFNKVLHKRISEGILLKQSKESEVEIN